MVGDRARQLLWLSEAVAKAPDYGALVGALREGFGGHVGACSLAEVSGGALLVVAAERDGLPVGQRRTLPEPGAERTNPGELLVPLFAMGELVGALIVSRGAAPPSEVERELAFGIAPQLAQAVAAMRTALLRRRWTSMLVHDFRSPIAVLSMNLDLLQSLLPDASDEVRDVVTDCCRSLKQLTGMTADLHDITRAEERGIALKRERIEAAALIARAVEGVRPLGPRLRFAVTCPADLAIDVDVPLLLRVLDNILSNALRYAEAGAEVRLDASSDGDAVTIGIENDGRALDPADGPMLFAKYGESRGRGARGLGLYFCRLVLEAHGGTIGVAPPRQRGARFELVLPTGRNGRDA